jgi:class 3 adenylate cyclase
MTPDQNPDFETEIAEPFPLGRLFRRRFLPAFIGFIGVFLALIGFTTKYVTESMYLEEVGQRRAQTISRAVEAHAPEAWNRLMGQSNGNDTEPATGKKKLMEAFENEVHELNLSDLKVYDLAGTVLYATNNTIIGSRETGDAFKRVIQNGSSQVILKVQPDNTQLYELYVPLFDANGRVRAVFELYEPVDYLNATLLKAATPIVAIPAILLAILVTALNKLVNRAQVDIDARTNALNRLRRRIESFVSSTAVNAAKSASHSGDIPSQKLTTVLFFSDIRDFTSFAEANTPETVVEFLNHLMGLQVNILARHGGDVDKMIGDAVLARFDGEHGDQRAVAAAMEIIEAIKPHNYPRGIGIGIYRGEVISGIIGLEDRSDFTVIGDAVNIAARLCSAAKAGEIVVDAELTDETFGELERIQVKGRQEPLRVRRCVV